jgi:hypothetical protein
MKIKNSSGREKRGRIWVFFSSRIKDSGLLLIGVLPINLLMGN